MKIVFILIPILLFSCSNNEPRELIGTWKVKNYSLWEKSIGYMNGVRSLVYGHELTLNADSTYKEQSCGNFYFGKWTVSNDSLILKCDTMWYRLNYDHSKAIVSNSKSVFAINNNKLVKIYKGKTYSIQDDGPKKFSEHYSMAILK
jgi:hypothetical protein